MRQKLIEQGEIDAFTVIVKVFNTLHSEVDRPNRQKISEDTGELNSTISHLDVMDMYVIKQNAHSSQLTWNTYQDASCSRP